MTSPSLKPTTKTRRRLSQLEIAEIARLRELGHSYEWIAAQFGCSANAVSWQCCRLGADAPRSTGKSWEKVQGPQVMKRGDYTVRRFTAEEDARLLELSQAGIGNSEIARRLGRRPNSITGRLMALARRDARKERAA